MLGVEKILERDNGKTKARVAFICDYCGEIIDDNTGGVVEIHMDGDVDKLYTLHVGDCDSRFREKLAKGNPNDTFAWAVLPELVHDLIERYGD